MPINQGLGPIYASRLPVRREPFTDQLQPAPRYYADADRHGRPGHDSAREDDADLVIHPDEEGWTFPLYVQALCEPDEVGLQIGDRPGSVVLGVRAATELRDYLTAWINAQGAEDR